jgi:hypothetical protein
MSASNAGHPPTESTHSATDTPRNGLDAPSDAETAEPDREATTRASGAPYAEPAWARRTALVVCAIAVLFLLLPIAVSGLWDPFEFNVAELARRIAVNVYGAGTLSLEGADNSMPKLGDLGRGELAFDSIALGFRLFGLHEWAGRLPLALWGVVGVLSLYWLIARLVDRRAALQRHRSLHDAALFMQARTMLGDIVPMAAISMAFAGLAVAVFEGPGLPLARKLACGLAALGLLFGFLSRGALIGVAIPALGVGLAWAAMWASSQRKAERFGDVVGAASLALGGVAAWGPARARSSAPMPASIRCGSARPSPCSQSFPPSTSSFTISATRSFRGVRSFPLPSVGSSARRPSVKRAKQAKLARPRCVW